MGAIQPKQTSGKNNKNNSTASSSLAPQKPPELKVLRIGIGTEGKIVEEKIIRERKNVTIGESEKNQFVIFAKSIPSSFVLFALMPDGNYYLRFLPSMKGRISTPQGVVNLEDLINNGTARLVGKVYEYKLDESSRGKIVIDDVSILFQFVTAPPVQPKPQLPAAVKGGILRNIDWFYTTLAMCSLVFHLGFVIWLETRDWPVEETSLEDIPERFARLLIEPPKQEEMKNTKLEKGEGEGGEGDKQQDQKNIKQAGKSTVDSKVKTTISQAEREARQAALQARLTEQATQAAMLKLIGALGGDASKGSVVDTLGFGDVSGDLDSLLKQVKTVSTAGGGGGGILRAVGGAAGDGTGTVVAVGDTKVKGGDHRLDTGGVEEREIQGKMKRGELQDAGGTGILSADSVKKVFTERINAIKRCYEKMLRRNRSLNGRITLKFTIAPSGRVSSATATNEMNGEGGDEVAKCIEEVVRTFRFDPPQGGEVTFVYPFLFVPSQ